MFSRLARINPWHRIKILTDENLALGRSHAKVEEEIVAAKDEALKALGLAHAEIDRLMGLIADPLLLSVEATDGGVEIAAKPPEWAVKAIAASFYQSLDGASNWRAIEVGPIEHDGEWMLVTIKRHYRDSPEVTVGKLRLILERWAKYYYDVSGCDMSLIHDTEAAIRPTKEEASC